MSETMEAMSDVKDLAWDNAEETSISATIGGERWSGITAGSRFWASAMAAIDGGAEVEPFAPPSEPTPVERRRERYERECDPLLIAALGYRVEADAGQPGARERVDSLEADYLARKAEIREANPDPA